MNQHSHWCIKPKRQNIWNLPIINERGHSFYIAKMFPWNRRTKLWQTFRKKFVQSQNISCIVFQKMSRKLEIPKCSRGHVEGSYDNLPEVLSLSLSLTLSLSLSLSLLPFLSLSTSDSCNWGPVLWECFLCYRTLKTMFHGIESLFPHVGLRIDLIKQWFTSETFFLFYITFWTLLAVHYFFDWFLQKKFDIRAVFSYPANLTFCLVQNKELLELFVPWTR